MKNFFVLAILIILAIHSTKCKALQGSLVGGFRVVDKDQAKQYLPLVEKHYNIESNDNNYGLITEVEKVESQVIAGQRLVIHFTLAQTDCDKTKVQNNLLQAKDCKHVKKIESCVANVIIVAWKNDISLEGMKCNDVKTGSYKAQD